MEHEKRRHPRFSTVGRVEAPEICIFPGTLQDVGSGGCRVKFPIRVTIDMEQEYELKILFSQNTMTKEMVLIGQPVYNNGETTSEIGFKLLRSPDSRIFDAYIQSRMAESTENDFIEAAAHTDSHLALAR